MRILKGLGLADDLKKKAGVTAQQEKEAQARPGWFEFHSGADGHELIYDVCGWLKRVAVALDLTSSRAKYVTPEQGTRLGLHR